MFIFFYIPCIHYLSDVEYSRKISSNFDQVSSQRMKKSLPLLLFFVLLMQVHLITGKGMWGARRKREDEDESASSISRGGFEASRRRAAAVMDADPLIQSKSNLKTIGDKSSSSVSSGFSALLEGYLNMMELLVNSPEFDTLVSPESIQSIFNNLPELANVPELTAMLNSPQLQDPAILKETMKEGLKAIRSYSSEILSILNDPAKVDEMLEQLPIETRAVVRALLAGDTSVLKEMISGLPLTTGQKKLMSTMLDGNVENIMDNVAELVADPQQIEAARQQFLENPAMAEMLGIPEETLRNPRKFAQLMKQGVDAMKSQGSGLDFQKMAEESNSDTSRRFTASAAA